MPTDRSEARLAALEIALDALLAEIEELRERLDAHEATCPVEHRQIRLA